MDSELQFAIPFLTIYLFISCCWLFKQIRKNRRTIRPIGFSGIIRSSDSNSSNQYPFSGRVLLDNYVNSNITLPADLSHVIIQITPEPITQPPRVMTIPVQENFKYD
jgi:hypothetical protein